MPGEPDQQFSRLVEPHLDALFRAAYRLTRNTPDAEDLVQDTCVRACLKLNELREAGPVKAWLLRVMHNLFIDGARRARLSPIDSTGDTASCAEAVPSPAPTPEEALHSVQRIAQLERAWQQLDRSHRSLLALRAEGYTLPEISRITNTAIDALTMRLYRARQNLTRCLQEQQAPSNVFPMEAAK